MKFSCIITTYNDGELLRQSLTSILNQTYTDFELLLVDDGSATPVENVVADLGDSRIILLPQANDGLSSARNRALDHARGDYVCFLDADDVRSPWAFAEVERLVRSTNPDLVLTSGVYSGSRTELTPFMDAVKLEGMAEEEALEGTLSLSARKTWATAFEPQSANKFLSLDLIKRGKLRFPNGLFFEDILFHVMAIAHAETIEFVHSPSFTYFQRLLRPQTTASNGMLRFDIIATARMTFQRFERHRDFGNPRQRGAVSLGVLRLMEWCEQQLSSYHRFAYRNAVRLLLRDVNPLFLIIDEETPDPRRERDFLTRYAREVTK